MADTAPTPFASITGVRFRVWPVALAGLAIEPLLMLGREPARWFWKHGPSEWMDRPWIFVALACVFQCLVGLSAIFAMRRILPEADANLRWPPGRSSAGLAFMIGLGMGIVMLLADYTPDLVGGTIPNDYSIESVNAVGWIIAVACAPLGEETIFRGVLVGALAVLVPGRVRIGRLDLPLAAYLVAFLFAVVHWRSFIVSPLHLAIAQQSYAVIWGVVYAWLMQRSRSLLAPAIAHATGNAFEVALVIMWRALAI